MITSVSVRATLPVALLTASILSVGIVPATAQSPSVAPDASPAAGASPCAGPAASPAASPQVATSPGALTSPAASPAVAMSPSASPASAASPTVAGSPGAVSSPAATGCEDVAIVDFAFQPADVTVTVGTVVRWTNQDAAPHTATADDGSFDSGTLPQDASFEQTFDTTGTFGYFCKIHPDMQGTVTAQ